MMLVIKIGKRGPIGLFHRRFYQPRLSLQGLQLLISVQVLAHLDPITS